MDKVGPGAHCRGRGWEPAHFLKVATLNSLLNASQGLTTIVPIMFFKLLSQMPFHHILNRCYITYYHFIILLNVFRGSNL